MNELNGNVCCPLGCPGICTFFQIKLLFCPTVLLGIVIICGNGKKNPKIFRPPPPTEQFVNRAKNGIFGQFSWHNLK